EHVQTLPISGEAKEQLEKNKWVFEATSQREVFSGYKLLKHAEEKEIKPLPNVKAGDELTVAGLVAEDQFTTPRVRFNDATLVKEMEKLGIGRPSTYASIIVTLITRGYIIRDQRLLFPTDVGIVVCN